MNDKTYVLDLFIQDYKSLSASGTISLENKVKLYRNAKRAGVLDEFKEYLDKNDFITLHDIELLASLDVE